MSETKVIAVGRGTPEIPWQLAVDQSDAALARLVRALVVCRGQMHTIAPDNYREIRRGGCLVLIVSIPAGLETVFGTHVQPISMRTWIQPAPGGGTDPFSGQRTFTEGHWDRRGKRFVVEAPANTEVSHGS